MSDTAQLGYLALAKQTAKGTPNTAGLAAGGVLASDISLGLETSVEDSDPEIGGGRFQRNTSAMFGGARVGGSMEGVMRYATALPLLLLGAGFVEGAVTETATASGAFRHPFTLGTGVPTYLTAETSWGLARAVRRFTDCLVDSLTLSTEADGDTMFAADVIGVGETMQAGATAVTYEANDSRGTWLGSAVTIDGLGTYKTTSAEVKIGNNASDDEYVIGSRSLDDVTLGTLEAMFSASIRLGVNNPSVTDLYRAAAYGTKAGTTPGTTEPFTTSGAVTFGSGKLIGASATEKYRAVVTMPQIIIRPFTLDASGEDVLEVDLESRAYGSAITVDVYNARSTAY